MREPRLDSRQLAALKTLTEAWEPADVLVTRTELYGCHGLAVVLGQLAKDGLAEVRDATSREVTTFRITRAGLGARGDVAGEGAGNATIRSGGADGPG